MKKMKAFLVINMFKKVEDAYEVEGVFWKRSDARKFIRQLMEENADIITENIFRIRKFMVPYQYSKAH